MNAEFRGYFGHCPITLFPYLLISTIMKKKFHFIDLVLMLPAVIALIYGFVSTT